MIGRPTSNRWTVSPARCARCWGWGPPKMAMSEPIKTGMVDYQLDQVEGPQRHPAAGPTHRAAQGRLSPVRETLRGEGSYSRTAHFFCGAFGLGPSPLRALLALRLAGAAALKPTSRRIADMATLRSLS